MLQRLHCKFYLVKDMNICFHFYEWYYIQENEMN